MDEEITPTTSQQQQQKPQPNSTANSKGSHASRGKERITEPLDIHRNNDKNQRKNGKTYLKLYCPPQSLSGRRKLCFLLPSIGHKIYDLISSMESSTMKFLSIFQYWTNIDCPL